MIFEDFSNGTYVTAWDYSGMSTVIFISRPGSMSSELLAVYFLPSGITKSYVLQFTERIRKAALDPILVRKGLPRELRDYLSQHLLAGLEQLTFKEEMVMADSAWRYEQLLEWGESSAVAVLAKHMKVSRGTMRARLAQARLNGLLDSPGRGSRKPH